MKQWIKKIVLGACLTLSLLALWGCSKEETVRTIDPMQKQGLESSTLRYMESLGNLSDEELKSSIEDAEHRKDAIIYNGLTNFLNSRERLGAFVSADSAEAVLNADRSYTVELEASFEKRKLGLTLGISEDMQSFTEMSFEPDYSFGEKFSDAAGNLVVGMGTVIAVLTFIAWIISLFKYINVFEKKLKAAKDKKTAPAGADAAAVTAAVAAPVQTDNSAAGLSQDELQAVIAAAIAAYEAEMGNGDNGFVPGPSLNNGLVVRSIRRR